MAPPRPLHPRFRLRLAPDLVLRLILRILRFNATPQTCPLDLECDSRRCSDGVQFWRGKKRDLKRRSCDGYHCFVFVVRSRSSELQAQKMPCDRHILVCTSTRFSFFCEGTHFGLQSPPSSLSPTTPTSVTPYIPRKLVNAHSSSILILL